MPVPSDNVVRRQPGAPVTESIGSGIFVIGVSCQTRGKSTEASTTVVRSSGSNDSFPSTTKSPIRGVIKAIATATGYKDEEYYPSTHFRITNASGTPLTWYNFGNEEDPSTLKIDWSIAPTLLPPAIINHDVTAASSGGFTNTNTLYYSVSVLDHNANESTPGAIAAITPTGAASSSHKSVMLTWRAVSGASGYKVYRSTVDVASSGQLIGTITSGAITSFTDNNITPSGTPQTTNTTKFKPADGDSYKLYYNYADFNGIYNTPKTYYSLADVATDHGFGSDAWNIAKLVLDPKLGNAPAINICAVRSNTATDHLASLDALAEEHVQFVSILHGGESDGYYSDIAKYVYAQCEAKTDPINGQKERFAVCASPYTKAQSMKSVHTLLQAFQNTSSKGKHGLLVVPDGFDITYDFWYNPDGSVTQDYRFLDGYGNDITPQLMALSSAARYCGFRDPAEPLTEKDIRGFTFRNSPMSSKALEIMRDDWGAMVIENRFKTAVVSRSINMSLPVLSVEDGELNISATELLYIKPDIRRRMVKYRGRKNLTPILHAVKRTITTALLQYMNMTIIKGFGNVRAYQDPVERTKVRVEFDYEVIYPINKTWVSFSYLFNPTQG